MLSAQQMIFVVFVLMFPWQTMSEDCQRSPYSLPGFKIHGHVITSVSLSTISQCKHRCAAQQRCNSISFHQNTKKCEMHDGNHISHPESVLPSNGYVYVNVPTLRPPKRCSRKLCSYPLACVPEGESYKCVTCQEAKAEQVLSFSRKSAQDYAILDDPFVSVSAFTLSFWVQVDATSTSNAVFEYGTTTDDNAVSIYVTDSYVGVNVIGANKILYGVNLVDNKWHHLCLTWENTDGNIKFYIDAVLRHEFIGKKDEQLGKGSIVLGQDQKGFKTGFRDSVAFKGNLASVNMWSRAFPAGEVSVLASTCPTSEGDIVQWSTLKTKRSGMLELVCSNYCM